MKEMVIIAKKANPLNPIQFNVIAIIFILGFMPFSVAIISNLGSSSETVWVNSMEHHDDPLPLADDSLWLENGGSNLTSWYSVFANPNNDDKLDCSYITNGTCEGFWDDSGPTQPELYKGLGPQYAPYPDSAYSADDYYDIRSGTFTQSHFAPGHNNQYAGQSGSQIYSWYLSSKFNNEIEQNSTVDALRYWFTSGTSYHCGNTVWSNLTFEGEITFIYGNDSITYTDFEFETDNKFEYSAFDIHHGTWSSVCAVGFFVKFDFTGFESLEIHELNGIGDWDNTSIILTLKNFVNKDSPDDFGSTALPFAGADYFNLGVQHMEINPKETGFLIKTGTFVLAIITLVIALASTPYWDPVRSWFKGALN